MTWELLWKVVLVSTIGLFALMSLFVTFLGARDIKRLIRKLEDPTEDPQQDSNHG